VTLRQPVADVGRQQKRLVAVGRKEVLAHARNRLTRPDGPPLRNSLHATRHSDIPAGTPKTRCCLARIGALVPRAGGGSGGENRLAARGCCATALRLDQRCL
jgi:hypothetical protein